MFVFVLVCITLCPFWFCYHPGGEGGAGCFAFVVFWVSCCCGVLWLFLAVPWMGLQFVIMVFSDHTHLLLHKNNVYFESNKILF